MHAAARLRCWVLQCSGPAQRPYPHTSCVDATPGRTDTTTRLSAAWFATTYRDQHMLLRCCNLRTPFSSSSFFSSEPAYRTLLNARGLPCSYLAMRQPRKSDPAQPKNYRRPRAVACAIFKPHGAAHARMNVLEQRLFIAPGNAQQQEWAALAFSTPARGFQLRPLAADTCPEEAGRTRSRLLRRRSSRPLTCSSQRGIPAGLSFLRKTYPALSASKQPRTGNDCNSPRLPGGGLFAPFPLFALPALVYWP